MSETYLDLLRRLERRVKDYSVARIHRVLKEAIANDAAAEVAVYKKELKRRLQG